MCGNNFLCSLPDGCCSCPPQPHFPITSSFSPIFQLLSQKNSLLTSILNDILKLSEHLEKSPKPSASLTYELSSPSHILEKISSKSSYPYKLNLINSIPCPLYKDRNFSLSFRILDLSGNKVELQKDEMFTLGVFTVDYPPSELEVNKAGDRMLKGNIEGYGKGEVLFGKVCINDVSSHFRNGVLCLVVKTRGNSQVQPLVIPDLVVKARKMKETLSKIRKIE